MKTNSLFFVVPVTAAILCAAGGALIAQEKASGTEVKAAEKPAITPEVKTPGEAPPAPAAQPPQPFEFFKNNKLSGFLSVSYLYDFNNPSTDTSTGRSFDLNHNEFALNKFKLSLENAVDYNDKSWDAGYRASLIFGQDATLIQSTGLSLGAQGDLEEAYIEVNVPVGNGLKVSAGKWVTLQGVEVIEETVNPNWSEGNQFLLVENFTGTGLQLGYKWKVDVNKDLQEIETKFRVFNGWDVVNDTNNCASFMASAAATPCENTNVTLLAFGGPEEAGNTEDWRKGVELVVNHNKLGDDDLNSWIQLDYGHEEGNPALAGIPERDAQWWAAGLWLAYDLTGKLQLSGPHKLGLAFRGDYLRDKDGARTSGAPFTAPFPANPGMELYSMTFTLNYSPLENLQIRPEIRWDHSTRDVFDNHDDQVTLGVGTAFLF
jgi:hypothetical protein